MTLNILALDQSHSSCGFALITREGVSSGAWALAESLRYRAAGFFELRKRVTRIHKATPIHTIAHETPLLTRTDTPERLIALYGLVATIEAWAWPRGIAVISVDAKDHRATWLPDAGKRIGRDEWKRLAIERARQYGFDPRTDDEAEALAILDNVLLSRKFVPTWREANPFLQTLA